MRIGVVTFPGSLDDGDAARAARIAGAEAVRLWHGDADLHGVDAVVLPGGFSYGDYLRCGAIARFAKVMEVLVPAAKDGLPVLGICNGFQVLCESHLLPGALVRNDASVLLAEKPFHLSQGTTTNAARGIGVNRSSLPATRDERDGLAILADLVAGVGGQLPGSAPEVTDAIAAAVAAYFRAGF